MCSCIYCRLCLSNKLYIIFIIYISVPGKTRTRDKYRVVYSDSQRLELEKEFHFNKFITLRRKAEIAAMLNLSARQVKIWFQNRRAKERRQKKASDTIQDTTISQLAAYNDTSPDQKPTSFSSCDQSPAIASSQTALSGNRFDSPSYILASPLPWKDLSSDSDRPPSFSL